MNAGQEPPPRKALSSRLSAFFEVIVVALAGSFLTQAALSVYGFSTAELLASTRLLFIFLMSEATLTLVLIGLFLHARGESFRQIGLKWRNVAELRIGLLAIPVLFASAFLVGAFFHLVLPGYVSTTNPLLELIEDRQDLFLFLISSIYVGGIKEEIQRAFVLVRFERYLGGVTVGLALWSTFFAVGHQMQGVDNAFGAGVLGLLFGILYVWRRNLSAPMLAHAIYDVLTLVVFWKFILLY